MPSHRALIGAAEAAEIIGVDRSTFNRWVARGEVEPVLQMRGLTGARLFDADEIERIAARLEERASA